ncbi:MAG: type III-A CRISPR-associated RAMP protein Csm3 [Nitrospirae bacterium]|nr:MAG: type III-A CRISPR-associated RAMP protein Csm3 [Nitrospirota bacterium]
MARKLLGKIELIGTLECLSGLHIGASKENIEIGALDSPVMRDPVTDAPYIPGSSLKGKLRALLEKVSLELQPNRNGGTRSNPVMRHECDGWSTGDGQPGAPHCPVCRLFGSTKRSEGSRDAKNYPARLKVRDLHLTDASRAQLAALDTGLHMTEWKFENSIDRITSAANPRNLERVPKGAEFTFAMVYDVEDPDTVKEDLQNLKLAVQILQADSLGGHGSRGYGWVELRFGQTRARKVDWYRTRDEAAQKEVEGLDALNDEQFDELAKWFAPEESARDVQASSSSSSSGGNNSEEAA